MNKDPSQSSNNRAEQPTNAALEMPDAEINKIFDELVSEKIEPDKGIKKAHAEFNEAAAQQEEPRQLQLETINQEENQESSPEQTVAEQTGRVATALETVVKKDEAAQAEAIEAPAEQAQGESETSQENNVDASSERTTDEDDSDDSVSKHFSVRQLDRTADKMIGLANRIQEAGGMLEYAKQKLRLTGRSAIEAAQENNQAVSQSEAVLIIHDPELTPSPSDDNETKVQKQGFLRRALSKLKNRIFGRKNNKETQEEPDSTTHETIGTSESDGSAPTEADRAVDNSRTSDSLESRGIQLTPETDESAAREKRLNARRKELKASLRKQARRKIAQELVGNTKKFISESALADIGRAAAHVAQNVAAYAQGVHEAGIANVQAEEARRSETAQQEKISTTQASIDAAIEKANAPTPPPAPAAAEAAPEQNQ